MVVFRSAGGDEREVWRWDHERDQLFDQGGKRGGRGWHVCGDHAAWEVVSSSLLKALSLPLHPILPWFPLASRPQIPPKICRR